MTSRAVVVSMILSTILMAQACSALQGQPPVAAPPPPEAPPTPPAPMLAPEGLRDAVPPEVRYVFLAYVPEKAAPGCIKVLGETLELWVGSPPSRIEWQVRDPDDEHQWVIQYKGAAGGESALPAGRVVIPCMGTKAFRSPKAMRPGTWTYKVSVYECSGGRPAAVPACETDPQVIIWP